MGRKMFIYCFRLAVILPFMPGQYGVPFMLSVTIVGVATGVRVLIEWHYGLKFVPRFNRVCRREQKILESVRREEEGGLTVTMVSKNDGE